MYIVTNSFYESEPSCCDVNMIHPEPEFFKTFEESKDRMFKIFVGDLPFIRVTKPTLIKEIQISDINSMKDAIKKYTKGPPKDEDGKDQTIDNYLDFIGFYLSEDEKHLKFSFGGDYKYIYGLTVHITDLNTTFESLKE